MFTNDRLKTLLPKQVDSTAWGNALSKYFKKYKIDTFDRQTAFLAQALHESTYFTALVENLNYSATRLNEIFPKYFKNAGRDPNAYARNPEKIANIVYAGRLGNGDSASGDGYRYRGRGIFQLTGKDNYTAFGKAIGKSPEEVSKYLETIEGAVESACWFWNSRNCSAAADKKDINTVSKLINGGKIGLAERQKLYLKVIEALK